MIAGMTVVGALLWVMAPWVITLVGSHRFAASTPVFQILLMAYIGRAAGLAHGVDLRHRFFG